MFLSARLFIWLHLHDVILASSLYLSFGCVMFHLVLFRFTSYSLNIYVQPSHFYRNLNLGNLCFASLISKLPNFSHLLQRDFLLHFANIMFLVVRSLRAVPFSESWTTFLPVQRLFILSESGFCFWCDFSVVTYCKILARVDSTVCVYLER